MALPPAVRRDAPGGRPRAHALRWCCFPGALLRGEASSSSATSTSTGTSRVAALARAPCATAAVAPLGPRHRLSASRSSPTPAPRCCTRPTWLGPALPSGATRATRCSWCCHLALAALGTERHWRARLGAGSTGALGALWGGSSCSPDPLQSSVNLWHHFAGACWMPWVIVCAERAARRPPPARSAAALALAAGLQMLAGSADLCAMTWPLVASGMVASWARAKAAPPAPAPVSGCSRRCCGRSRRGSDGRRVVAGARRALPISRRDLPEDVRTAWSVPPAGLVGLAVPLDPARVPPDADNWARLSRWIPAAVPGVAVPRRRGAGRGGGVPRLEESALARSAAPRRRLRGPGGGHGSAGAGLPAADGARPALAHLPLPLEADARGGPSRGRGGGTGYRGAPAQPDRYRGNSRLAGLLLAVALVSVLVSRRYGPNDASTLAALLAVTAAAVLVLAARGRVRPALAATIVGALAVVDLVGAHAQLNPTADPMLLLDPPPLIASVDRGEGRRLYVYDYHSLPGTSERLLGRTAPYSYVTPPAGWDPRVFNMVALRLYLVPPFCGTVRPGGPLRLRPARALPARPQRPYFFLGSRAGHACTRACCSSARSRGSLALHERGLEGLRLERLSSLVGEPLRVFAVPDPRPRAWLVGRTRIADREAAFARSPTPPSTRAPRRSSPRGPARGRSGRPRVGAAGCSAGRTGSGSRRRAPGASSCSPMPTIPAGARRRRTQALLRANVAFRAVAVPQGATSSSSSTGRGRCASASLSPWSRPASCRLPAATRLPPAKLDGWGAGAEPTARGPARQEAGRRRAGRMPTATGLPACAPRRRGGPSHAARRRRPTVPRHQPRRAQALATLDASGRSARPRDASRADRAGGERGVPPVRAERGRVA